MLERANPAESIYRFIQRVIEMCNSDGIERQLAHNGTVVRVYPGSHEEDIFEKWALKREMYAFQNPTQ